MSEKLSGGFNNYYLVQVTNPQRMEQPPYQAECEDIIQALNMTFDEGCLFKALWRNAAARLGNGKPGNSAVYDAEKMIHYANRIFTKESGGQKKEAEEPISEALKKGEEIHMSLSELFTLLTGEAAEGEVMSLAGWHTHVPNRLGVMPVAVAMSKAEQVDVVRADGTTITHVFPHEIDWSDKIAPFARITAWRFSNPSKVASK
ncbi:3'-phosphatase 5'-polynucleotide kinase [Escherichia phage vB_Eco_AL25]|uniref:3'-phosphatase 5'-polynucleotide kinase n=1 Tax=Escherichia phage VEc25 TaxID=2794959 RepID=A0A7T1JPR9_9CAUD|nr:hypothetical protein vec25_44 [Escherichia phage VEc25]CAH0462287.1 hypothetical protein vec25_44 [EscherichiavirusVEc25] [Escherichia phage vB_Eco_SPSP]CAH6421861.1 3'-phosphatase 5'-polynucleotide kinase [Escherichia phage vB_Eco_AL25]